MDVRLTAVYVADARLVAEGVAQPEDAMAVFIGPGGRGRVSPFTVQRSYTGAGGWYQELMVLLDSGGEVVWRGEERPLTLRGSNKVDTFSDDVDDAALDSSDDHELVILFSDGRGGGLRRGPRFDEVARVPLAVLDENPPYADGSTTAVLSETLKKSTVVWVQVPDVPEGRAVPVWYGMLDDKVYVLTGGSEQQVPGLADASHAVLTARSKDLQSRIVDVDAATRVIPASDPLFDKVAAILLPRRLNLRDGDAAEARWRKECTLVELTPSSVPAEA